MFVIKQTKYDFLLLGMVVVLVIAANLPEAYAPIDRKYLLIALTVIVVVCLVRYVRLLLVLVMTILVVGANLPAEMAQRFGIDPIVMLFTLIAIVALVVANHFVKIPTGVETKHTARPSSYGAKALFNAVNRGNIRAVQSLLQTGVNVNVRTISGKTVLMVASYRGYGDIVQMLINAGAQITQRDNDGFTALDYAKRKGFNRVESLIKGAAGKAKV